MSTKVETNLFTRAKTWVSTISTDKQEMFLKLFILSSAAILGKFCFAHKHQLLTKF